MLTSTKSPAAQIVDFMNRVYYNRMTTISGGNLSICEDDGTVWISPTGVDKGGLTEDDIVRITPDGEPHGKNRPSVEHHFHRAIYRNRPDIRAILHAHPPMLVSYSIAGELPDPAIVAGAASRCGKSVYAPYAVPGSTKLGENIAAEFDKGYDVVMLENHGVVTGGPTMPEVFQKFETIDHVARMAYGAKLLGGTLGRAVEGDGAREPACDCRKTAAEEEAAAAVAAFSQRAYKRELFRSGYGTIAWRTGEGRFLVVPDECERENLTAAAVALVTPEGAEAGKGVSAATVAFCRAAFAGAPGINAIYFSQAASIMAYAVSGVAFDPRVIPESYLLLREAPRFAAGERAAAAAKLSTRHPVAVIANDCVVTAGATLLQGFDRLEVLDYSAKATISAVSFGGMRPMSDAQVAEIVREFHLEP